MKRILNNLRRPSHFSSALQTGSLFSRLYFINSQRYENLGPTFANITTQKTDERRSFVTFRNPFDPNQIVVPSIQIGASSNIARLADIMSTGKDKKILEPIIEEFLSKDPNLVLKKYKGKLLMEVAVENENYAAAKLLLQCGSPKRDVYKLANNLFNRRLAQPKNNIESYIYATEFVTLVWRDKCEAAIDLLARYKTMPLPELYNFAVKRLEYLYKQRGSMPSHMIGLENPQALRPWLAELISGREKNLADLIKNATDKVQFDKDLKQLCADNPHIVNKQMSNSYMPLDYAALLGKYFVAKKLLRYGAIITDGYKVLVETSHGKLVTNPKLWSLTMYWAAIDYANTIFAGDISGSRNKLDPRFACIFAYPDKDNNREYFFDLVNTRLNSMCKMYGVPKHLEGKEISSLIKKEVLKVFPRSTTELTTYVDKPVAKLEQNHHKSK
jgi:hypothetical protein